MRQVREERTGWRDQALSQRHRRWGFDCPVTDLDFLVVEYDKGKPVAIVEYKHEKAAKQYASRPSYQAIINLGNMAGLPVFAVRYAGDFSWWRVVPLNDCAKGKLAQRKKMTEEDWVTFLYLLRGYVIPMAVLEGLDVEL